MRQLIVELSDQEMAALEVLAETQRIDPASLAKTALLKVLAGRASEPSPSGDSIRPHSRTSPVPNGLPPP
ncbi:hypothetical protein [Rugamonas sp. DEMB1]|uniref:hypothetical protein n=1 Tax=Rugamonas sp. DEMB1 TaxID=3039386 RepID=UPI00244AC909|nr:hypothetical protein [Rugamonas sp. DEMB1]WGG51304.1 hypothetical protein QC826_03250 [Rugamonas sp. DEMB1]